MNVSESKKRKRVFNDSDSEQLGNDLKVPSKKMRVDASVNPLIEKKRKKLKEGRRVSFNLHNNSMQEIPPIIKESGMIVVNDSFILRPDLRKEDESEDEECTPDIVKEWSICESPTDADDSDAKSAPDTEHSAKDKGYSKKLGQHADTFTKESPSVFGRKTQLPHRVSPVQTQQRVTKASVPSPAKANGFGSPSLPVASQSSKPQRQSPAKSPKHKGQSGAPKSPKPQGKSAASVLPFDDSKTPCSQGNSPVQRLFAGDSKSSKSQGKCTAKRVFTDGSKSGKQEGQLAGRSLVPETPEGRGAESGKGKRKRRRKARKSLGEVTA